MSIAVMISICFAVAGIMLHNKQKTLVSLFTNTVQLLWHCLWCTCSQELLLARHQQLYAFAT